MHLVQLAKMGYAGGLSINASAVCAVVLRPGFAVLVHFIAEQAGAVFAFVQFVVFWSRLFGTEGDAVAALAGTVRGCPRGAFGIVGVVEVARVIWGGHWFTVINIAATSRETYKQNVGSCSLFLIILRDNTILLTYLVTQRHQQMFQAVVQQE